MTFDQRITLHKLEVLSLVVELGGVRPAAERLWVTQPVISAHLRSLEQYVNAPLFRKDGRRLALTEAGTAVYNWARSVFDEREALERHLGDLRAGNAGSVSVAASMTTGGYVLPPLLTAFKKEHKGVKLTLLVSDPEAAIGRVEDGTCDFCLVMTDGPIDPDIFRVRHVAHDRYVLVTAPHSQIPASVTVEEVAELPAVCPPAGVAVRRIQDAALRDAGVASRPVAMELGSGEAIKQAVVAGIGVAVISWQVVAQEVARGELRVVDIAGTDLTYALTYAQRRDTKLTPVQQLLSEGILAIGSTHRDETMHESLDCR